MTSKYGTGALTKADARIRQLGHGIRNPQSFPEAAGIYELCNGGEIDYEEADRVLSESIGSTGLPRHEVWSILKSAKKKVAGRARRRPESGQASATLPQEPPPTYVEPEVIRALCAASVSVTESDKACRYLDGRGISPERVDELRAARVLPLGSELPDELADAFRRALSMFKVRGQWRHVLQLGFELVLPLVDSCGHIRSLQLRCLEDHGDDIPTNGVCLRPSRKKLVLANAPAQALLKPGTKRMELWADRDLEVCVVEGESDFLCAVTEETDYIRAVFGIFQGSWTPTYAAKIPDNARVVIATDDDDQGHVFAAKIQRTLGERHFYRWTPNKGKDVCDAGGLTGGQCSDKG